MLEFSVDPLLLGIAAGAFAAGALLAWLITWLSGRRRKQALEATIRHHETALAEREEAFSAARTELAQAFAELANRSLKSNSEHFLRLAEQNLSAHNERAKSELGAREQAVENLVKPIRASLQDAQRQIAELEKARSEAYGSIRNQLEQMQAGQQSLARETQNLVNALRRPEVRGRWGEITLRRLVELAGMVEHCDFREQVHQSTDEQNIRPDMIVRLPDSGELVVDVKTPLDAYLSAAEASDDNERRAQLQRHAKNLRAHIRLLASKAYWRQFEQSPEFVILFIPGDQFLSAALNEEPDLIDYALTQQIILATPTSFIALLKAVAYGWRQLALAENAAEIRTLAEDLYGRLGAFVGHLNKMGRQLSSTVDNYNRAVGSLERNVLPGARKFTELGARSKKSIERLESLEPVPRTMVEPLADDDAPPDPDTKTH